MAMTIRAPAPPRDWTIPEQTMWVTMQAIHQTTGPQARALLTKAGLGRFLTTPPTPDSMQPVAAAAELGALYGLLHRQLGDALTRLFHRNCGEIIAAALLQLPEAAHLAAAAKSIAPDAQVRWLAETIAEWMGRAWAPMTITEDAVACYLTIGFCLHCAGISGATIPLCATGTVVNQRLARAWLGRRVRVDEITCTAMRAAHCTHALYK
jgi:predicted hydrocarbon binding protein